MGDVVQEDCLLSMAAKWVLHDKAKNEIPAIKSIYKVCPAGRMLLPILLDRFEDLKVMEFVVRICA